MVVNQHCILKSRFLDKISHAPKLYFGGIAPSPYFLGIVSLLHIGEVLLSSFFVLAEGFSMQDSALEAWGLHVSWFEEANTLVIYVSLQGSIPEL